MRGAAAGLGLRLVPDAVIDELLAALVFRAQRSDRRRLLAARRRLRLVPLLPAALRVNGPVRAGDGPSPPRPALRAPPAPSGRSRTPRYRPASAPAASASVGASRPATPPPATGSSAPALSQPNPLRHTSQHAPRTPPLRGTTAPGVLRARHSLRHTSRHALRAPLLRGTACPVVPRARHSPRHTSRHALRDPEVAERRRSRSAVVSPCSRFLVPVPAPLPGLLSVPALVPAPAPAMATARAPAARSAARPPEVSVQAMRAAPGPFSARQRRRPQEPERPRGSWLLLSCGIYDALVIPEPFKGARRLTRFPAFLHNPACSPGREQGTFHRSAFQGGCWELEDGIAPVCAGTQQEEQKLRVLKLFQKLHL